MSLDVVDTSAHTAQLQQAILLYGMKSASVEYATLHRVSDGGQGQPMIGAGVPMTRDTLLMIARSLAASSRRSQGILPPNILSFGVNHTVWYVPPHERTVFFDCKEGVGKRAGKTPHPALIFAVCRNEWSVFAIKTRQRPTAATKLYNAPYMNVWKEGGICTGSTPLPNESVAETVDQWVQAFFDSNFSHPNHDKVVRYEGGCHAFWKDALDGKYRKFPNAVLTNSATKTLGDLVMRLEGGKA